VKFQPRLKSQRETPGPLFYPAEYSHVFEKYWDNIDCQLNHPVFSQESPFTQACMRLYTTALSSLNCADFTPQVHAEAEDSDVRTATDAAISRLLPIPDGPDLWSIIGDMTSPVTDSGAPAPGQDPHNVATQPGGPTRRMSNGPKMVMPRAWCKRDRRAVPHATPLTGESDGTLRGLPA
jgi:hypothetical protein